MAMGSVEFSHTHTTKSYLGTASCVTKIKTNRNSFRTLHCLVTNSSKCAIQLSIDAMFLLEANQKGSVHIGKSDRWITCFRRSKVRRTAKATPPPSADAKVKTELSALGTFSVVQVQTSWVNFSCLVSQIRFVFFSWKNVRRRMLHLENYQVPW